MAIFKNFFKSTSKTPYVGLPTNEYVYKLPQATKKTSRSTGTATRLPTSTNRNTTNALNNLVKNPSGSLTPKQAFDTANNLMRQPYAQYLENRLKGSANSGATASSSPSTSSGSYRGSSGGSSGGGYSSGGSSTVSTPRYDAAYDRAMAQQQRAYDRAMAEYNQAKAAYQAYYDKLARQRKANLDATLQANNASADKSAQDAYVAYMNNLKNLPQQLRNAGVSGGGSETTIADIANTYQNNRNNIMTNRDNNNSRAQLAYSQGLASDYGDYINNVNSLTVPTMGDITVNAGTSRSKTTTKSSGSSGTRKISGTSSGTTSSDTGSTKKTNNEKLNNVSSNKKTSSSANDDLNKLYNQYVKMGLSEREIEERLRRLGILE